MTILVEGGLVSLNRLDRNSYLAAIRTKVRGAGLQARSCDRVYPFIKCYEQAT